MTRRSSSLAAALLAVLVACGSDDDDGNDMCPADAVQVADVAGDWLVADLALTSSDCSGEVDEIIADAIARTNQCLFRVSQDNARVSAVDCGERVWEGCVDESGGVAISYEDSESDLGCTVTVDAQISANLNESPTSGTLRLEVDYSGTCVFEDDCEAVVEGAVTEQP